MGFLVLIAVVSGAALWFVGLDVAFGSTPKALPEPEDPAPASRERELAAWNDPRPWRGCSDYPPPSSVKPVERQ